MEPTEQRQTEAGNGAPWWGSSRARPLPKLESRWQTLLAGARRFGGGDITAERPDGGAKRHGGRWAVLGLLAIALVAALVASKREHRVSAPAFVSAQLGSRAPHAPLTRRPAPGVVVTIRPSGFTYDTGPGGALTLTDETATGTAHRFAHGTLARTPYGSHAVVVDKARAKVETLSTVEHRLGFHTWQWRLETKLEGRVADSGWVGFFERTSNRLMSVSIPPVKIVDARGRDVTPDGARWGLVTNDGQQYLTLALDDSELPIPYTIDPGAYRTNVTNSSTAASGTFTLTVPATVNAKDLLLVHEAGKATTATSTFPTAPTDNSGGNAWAQVSGTNVANTTVDQFVWWKWAVAGDATSTVTVTIPSSTLPAVTTAVVDVYKGLDSTASGPQTTGATNVGTTSRKFTTPAITPTGATTQEHMIMMVSGTFATSMA